MQDTSITTGAREAGSTHAMRRLADVAGATEAAVVRTEAALVRLLPEWWGLWERAERTTPFQSPAWLWPWWRSFHPGDLFVVAVRRHGELVALAPLYLETGPLGRRLLPIGISASDELDILIDPLHRTEAGAALVRALIDSADEWDSCHFEEMGAAAEAQALPRPDGFGDEVADQSASPVLDLRAPLRRPRRLVKAWRRMERRGDTRIVEADASNVAAMVEALIDLHRERWTSRGQPGVLAVESVRDFHRQAAPGLQAAGILRLYGLSVAGGWIGLYYGFVHRGRAFGYLSGFDPIHASESPGAILLDHAITQARAGGCREFDFLRGQEPYK